MGKQMSLPGLESFGNFPKGSDSTPKPPLQERIDQLEARLLDAELEIIMLKTEVTP